MYSEEAVECSDKSKKNLTEDRTDTETLELYEINDHSDKEREAIIAAAEAKAFE